MKSTYYPHHVCLSSACLSVLSARLPLDGFQLILILGTLRISVQKLQILLKLNKIMGHFTKRSEYVLFLPATRIRHKNIFMQHNILTVLTLTNTSTIHRQLTVTFPLQKCYLTLICLSYFTRYFFTVRNVSASHRATTT